MNQLRELATPFKGDLVKAPPRGKHGSYVSHSTVNERALSVVGPFDMKVVEIVRGWTDSMTINKGKDNERTFPERHDAIVGVVVRITSEIDGRLVSVEEAGDVEGAAAQSDGENLKEAVSDAFKRCWMRPGLGLHLWSQDDYFLDRQLDKNAEAAEQERYEVRDGTGGLVDEKISKAADQAGIYDEDDPERPFK